MLVPRWRALSAAALCAAVAGSCLMATPSLAAAPPPVVARALAAAPTLPAGPPSAGVTTSAPRAGADPGATGTPEDPGAAGTPEDPGATGTPADPMAAAIAQRIIDDPEFRREFILLIQARIADEPSFRDWFIAEVTAKTEADPTFAAIWRAALRAGHAESLAKAGPTTWTGRPIMHPGGYQFAPNITRWAELVLSVMAEHNIDPYYLPGILAQIQQESSGNPNAVNNWDVNADRGYASMGLLQVIAPTYRVYAPEGYEGTLIKITVRGADVAQQFASPWQTVPYSNIWASLNYVINSYGYGKFKSWNNGRNSAYVRDAGVPRGPVVNR